MKTSASLLLNAMTPESAKLRAENNLKALPEKLQKRVGWIINAGMDDAQSTVRIMTGTADDLRVLEVAFDLEKAGQDRKTRLDLIKRTSAKFKREDEAILVEVMTADSLLDGTPNTALSPMEAGALAQIETGWQEARRLADAVKNFSRATTAAKTLCGIRLRAIREHYFGADNSKGGRPSKTAARAAVSSWESMLADKVGISRDTATRWMQMADAVEALAESKGLDLQSICEKLPWDWTPEEVAAMDATVHALTQDKTQRELLQSDFLSTLGYTAPERINSSNNQTGKNGEKKKPAKNPQQLLKERQEAARLLIFGTDKPGRCEPGSVARWMDHFVETAGAEVEALPQAELRDFYEHTIKPAAALFRKLANL